MTWQFVGIMLIFVGLVCLMLAPRIPGNAELRETEDILRRIIKSQKEHIAANERTIAIYKQMLPPPISGNHIVDVTDAGIDSSEGILIVKRGHR